MRHEEVGVSPRVSLCERRRKARSDEHWWTAELKDWQLQGREWLALLAYYPADGEERRDLRCSDHEQATE